MGNGEGCFNAAKMYAMTWYEDRTLELNADELEPQTIKLHAFVDYPDTSDGDVIVLRVGDLFMQVSDILQSSYVPEQKPLLSLTCLLLFSITVQSQERCQRGHW